jgi:hypothetical protein
MAICEKCGTRFTPSAQAPDCPSCAPAPRKMRPASAAPATAGAPRARPAATPAAAAGASTVRREAAPAAAARTSARPTSVPTRPPPGAHLHPREHHASPAPKPLLDQATKIGFAVVGGLAVIVLIVVYVVSEKKAKEKAAADAYEKSVTDLRDQLVAVDVNDEAAVGNMIQTAKDKEGLWKQHALAPEIQALVAKQVTSLEKSKERKDVVAKFTRVEEGLKNSDNMTADKVKEQRRLLDELELKIDLAGPEFRTRYDASRKAADNLYATRLVEDAVAIEKQNPDNPRTALVKFQLAEDELRTLYDKSIKEKKNELKDFYEPLYKRAIEASDRLATALFTTEVIEKLPWTDCLSGQRASEWNPTQVKGFSGKVENNALWLTGPDKDAGRYALIAIGDREQWRNFVLDLEFTIEKGDLDMYFRLGRQPSAATEMVALHTEGTKDRTLKAGKTYRAKASMIGSHFIFRFQDEDMDTPPEFIDDLPWQRTRKGAIGLLVPPDTRARFTRFKVRELR